MTEFTYVGSELELFAAAQHWKSYWASNVRPFINGDVLEVGAGIGSNTPLLYDEARKGRWVCLEPDPQLTAQLSQSIGSAGRHEVVCGTIASLDPAEKFDTIIYIDVLEHIEGDAEELQTAAGRLREGGRIVVLSPAHQKLFTPFDAAIGHFRRYDKPMMRRISPPGLELERLIYLDSVGMLASMANRLLLKQSMPTAPQLAVWDNYMVPVSTMLDRVLGFAIGKTIVGVWRKPAAR